MEQCSTNDGLMWGSTVRFEQPRLGWTMATERHAERFESLVNLAENPRDGAGVMGVGSMCGMGDAMGGADHAMRSGTVSRGAGAMRLWSDSEAYEAEVRLAELKRRAAAGELSVVERKELEALERKLVTHHAAREAHNAAARLAELKRRAAAGDLTEEEREEREALERTLATHHAAMRAAAAGSSRGSGGRGGGGRGGGTNPSQSPSPATGSHFRPTHPCEGRALPGCIEPSSCTAEGMGLEHAILKVRSSQ